METNNSLCNKEIEAAERIQALSRAIDDELKIYASLPNHPVEPKFGTISVSKTINLEGGENTPNLYDRYESRITIGKATTSNTKPNYFLMMETTPDEQAQPKIILFNWDKINPANTARQTINERHRGNNLPDVFISGFGPEGLDLLEMYFYRFQSQGLETFDTDEYTEKLLSKFAGKKDNPQWIYNELARIAVPQLLNGGPEQYDINMQRAKELIG
jgi:hypothetical protein